jgi:hypothetical protein
MLVGGKQCNSQEEAWKAVLNLPSAVPNLTVDLSKVDSVENLGYIDLKGGNIKSAVENFSKAYKLSQAGEIDDGALRVEQHEVRISDQNLGTDNLQQCIAVVVHDSKEKKALLAHVDKYADCKSLNKAIEKFRDGKNNKNLKIHLIGGRNDSLKDDLGRIVSHQNLKKILDNLPEDINIESSNLFESPNSGSSEHFVPQAFVFNPQSGEFKNAVPNKVEPETFFRKMHVIYVKPELFDVDKDKNNIDKRFLVEQAKKQQASFISAWEANQGLEPALKVIESEKADKIDKILHKDFLGSVKNAQKKSSLEGKAEQIRKEPSLEGKENHLIDALVIANEHRGIGKFFNQPTKTAKELVDGMDDATKNLLVELRNNILNDKDKTLYSTIIRSINNKSKGPTK